ncbi:Aspartate--tRNA ligase [subsurface metagenome]
MSDEKFKISQKILHNSPVRKNRYRDYWCGNISKKNIGNKIKLSGWVQKRRDLGNIIFIDLRDRTGIVQVVFDPDISKESHRLSKKLRSEYVITVEGKVRQRPDESINYELRTGEVEVISEKLEILNESKTPPFLIKDDIEIDEKLRFKYRYLDFRRPIILKTFIFRDKIIKAVREFLMGQGFVEVETPILAKSTPEGARDYLIPSRVHKGSFYALPQSPQLFKQILMISGFERYFQIAKVFRDEDVRANRQPEHTQIDIEMSFVDVEDIFKLNEEMLKYLFEKCLGIELKTPFERKKYSKVIDMYGTDKPDLRFGLHIVDVTEELYSTDFQIFRKVIKKKGKIIGINVRGAAKKFTRKKLDELSEVAKNLGAMGIFWIIIKELGEIQSPIVKYLKDVEKNTILNKFEAKAGDLLILMADSSDKASTILGQIRLYLADKLSLIPKNTYKILWVYDFPLFEWEEEENRYQPMHHPFTSPNEETIKFLKTNPSKVRSKHYDLVLNGSEIAGGSIRINNSNLQKEVFRILGHEQKEIEDNFGFLLEAFEYGAPPHGGIAYGFDRLVAELLQKKYIRDVIAFPKTQKATCLLTGAPDEVTKEQLEELNIKIIKNKN